MADRLISADDLIEKAYRLRLDGRELIAQMILSAPTLDAEPVRHGRWEFGDELNTGIYALCSVCGESIYQCGTWHYCPNCGAKMDEVEDAD